MKLKSILLVLAAVTLAIAPMQDAFAQRGKFKGHGRGYNPDCPNYEKRTEYRNYCQNELLPKMEELKKELDSKLSSTDLEKLNQLRKRAAELREEAMKKRAERRAQAPRSKPSYEERQQFRKEMEQHRQQMQSILDEVDKIIEKNKWILQDIEPKLDKLMPEPRRFRDFQPPKDGAPKIHPDEFFNGMRFHREFDIERFMLWDGSNFINRARNFDDVRNFIRANVTGTVKNYPNPFSEKTTIEINSDKEQKARINLFDINGEFISEIFNGKLNKGKNEIQFVPSSVKNLKSGTYYYIITLEDGQKLQGTMIYSK